MRIRRAKLTEAQDNCRIYRNWDAVFAPKETEVPPTLPILSQGRNYYIIIFLLLVSNYLFFSAYENYLNTSS